MSLYLGIDFGTSTTYITAWDPDKNTVREVKLNNIADYNTGKAWFPNVIYYEPSGNRVIGSMAWKQGQRRPDSAVFSIKREIGNAQWSKTIQNTGRIVTATDVCRDIFDVMNTSIRKDKGGEPIDGVVLTVPYAYLHRERSLIQDAAQAAGLDHIRQPQLLFVKAQGAQNSAGALHCNIIIGSAHRLKAR